ncbi:MAG: aminomethyl-transferring glycine dehydrogenase subunit GcvPA [Candidatus Zixiibacteriota bacterium]
MTYIPNTDDDRARMLRKIGVDSFERLLETIPPEARNTESLGLPAALSEPDLIREFSERADENRRLVCFAGGGVYDHFIPSAVTSILSRPEFMTAYTPYQPEVSQGTLQVIYEFQSHICRLTGMQVANASLYDGASAAAEAALTSMSHTGRKRIVISETLNPLTVEVIRTYSRGFQAEIVVLPHSHGVTDMDRLADAVDDQTACFIHSQPNFFGCLEDVSCAAEITHRVGALLIVSADPISLALLKSPGSLGADIVVGEAQSLGIPLSFGGPLAGFYATGKELVRKLPGRLVGRTTDIEGRSAFTLTLQTREQHIKRARATSNICTNQALCATAATVYLSLMGKHGLKRVADLSLERAHQAAKRIFALNGFEPAFEAPFHREFAINTPVPAAEIIANALESGILAGIDLGRFHRGYDNRLLIAFTEQRVEQEVDRLIDSFRVFCVNEKPARGVQESLV